MSDFQDQYAKHGVFAMIELLEKTLSNTELQSNDLPDTIALLERLVQVHRHTQNVVLGIDPILIPIATSNSIEQSLSQIIAEVNNFNSNRNPGHLTNANSGADVLLGWTATINQPTSTDRVQDVGKSITALRRLSGDYIDELIAEQVANRKILSDFGDKVEQTTANVEAQTGRLDKSINDFQSRTGTVEAEREKQFSAAQAKRLVDEGAERKAQEKLLRDRFNEFDDKLSAQSDEFINKSDALIGQTEDEADALLTQIERHEDAAKKLLNVIGTTGMTAGYKEVAESASKSQVRWNGIAVASLIGLIITALSLFFDKSNGANPWEGIAIRIFVASAFGLLAAYGSRLADRYHVVERRNRKYALELSSIGPYLANMDEDKQNEFKLLLAEKLFGQEDSQPNLDNDKFEAPTTKLLKIMETLAKKIPGA